MPATLHDITKENPPEYFLIDTSALWHVVAQITPQLLTQIKKPKKLAVANRCADFQRFWNAAILSPNPSIVLLPDFVIDEYKNLYKNSKKKLAILDDFMGKIPHIPIKLENDMLHAFWKLYSENKQMCVVDVLNVIHARKNDVNNIFSFDQHFHLVDGLHVYTHPSIIK
jgi:predicted nucleic acid-binding protein